MRTQVFCRLIVVGLFFSCWAALATAAVRVTEYNWNMVRRLGVQTPNARLSAARKEAWFAGQLKRVLGKPGTATFHGYSAVTSIREENGQWVVTAVPALTDDEQREHEARLWRRKSEPIGSFSGAGIAGGALAGPPARAATVHWITKDKPALEVGRKHLIDAPIIGGAWDHEEISLMLDAAKLDIDKGK